MRAALYLLFISHLSLSCLAQPPDDQADLLYEKFTQAYDELDADKIADLYTEDAVILNLYDGAPANSRWGRPEIQNYFQDFFQSFRAVGQSLRLTFKVTERRKTEEHILDNGFYQLEIIRPNGPSDFYYGKFSTVLAAEGQAWKFSTDATTNTDAEEYDQAALKP